MFLSYSAENDLVNLVGNSTRRWIVYNWDCIWYRKIPKYNIANFPYICCLYPSHNAVIRRLTFILFCNYNNLIHIRTVCCPLLTGSIPFGNRTLQIRPEGAFSFKYCFKGKSMHEKMVKWNKQAKNEAKAIATNNSEQKSCDISSSNFTLPELLYLVYIIKNREWDSRTCLLTNTRVFCLLLPLSKVKALWVDWFYHRFSIYIDV